MEHDSGIVARESTPGAPPPDPLPSGDGEADDSRRLAKKRAKVRAAWIAFVGRILAQLIGALATVLLGLYVVRTFGVGDRAPRPPVEPPPPTTAAAAVAPRSPRLSVVVLPFVLHGPSGRDGYLADGLTEALIADLSHFEDLRVISRTSSMAYRDASRTAPQVARELDVDLIVEGSLARERDRLRVTARLVDAHTDDDLWAWRDERPVRDLLAMQVEVSRVIALRLHAVISPRQEQRRVALAGVDPAAYDTYLRGRQAFHRRTPADLVEAERYFHAALEKAPRFAMAYAALAETHGLRALDAFGATDARSHLDAAERAATAALAIDDTNADAHLAVAMVRHRRDWDWNGAEQAFRRALALHESHPTTHQWFAIFLAERRRSVEAIAHAERAVALDPASAPVLRTAGLVRMHAGRLDEAREWLDRALAVAPTDDVSRLMLATILLAARRPAPARELAEAARDPALEDQRLAVLVHAARLQRDAEAVARWHQAFLARPSPRSLVAEARVHLAFGDDDALIATAERAIAARTQLACALLVHPVFAPVRNDPRLRALARQAGLP